MKEEISEESLADIKKRAYAGVSEHCYFNTRKELKGLIEIAEKNFEAKRKLNELVSTHTS